MRGAPRSNFNNSSHNEKAKQQLHNYKLQGHCTMRNQFESHQRPLNKGRRLIHPVIVINHRGPRVPMARFGSAFHGQRCWLQVQAEKEGLTLSVVK
jgi:hypothetical protein